MTLKEWLDSAPTGATRYVDKFGDDMLRLSEMAVYLGRNFGASEVIKAAPYDEEVRVVAERIERWLAVQRRQILYKELDIVCDRAELSRRELTEALMMEWHEFYREHGVHSDKLDKWMPAMGAYPLQRTETVKVWEQHMVSP